MADYVEPGASATDDRRPEFQRMIDAATAKPPAFDVILVHSFSRFFRDQFQLEFYVRRLAKNGKTGKSGRYRYYTCCTKARQGETGCRAALCRWKSSTASWPSTSSSGLLQPKRLEQILSRVLDRREERAERRTAHIAELRKRAAEADAKLKRLYDAIENGIADLSDPMLKDRVPS